MNRTRSAAIAGVNVPTLAIGVACAFDEGLATAAIITLPFVAILSAFVIDGTRG